MADVPDNQTRLDDVDTLSSPTAATAGTPAPARDTDAEALIGAAQSRRDWERISTLRSEAAQLRHRILELERSPSRRALAPIRRLVRILKPTTCQAGPDKTAPIAPARGLALVIDNEWPQPERDSGSVDIYNLMVSLRQLGFDAILAAAGQHDGDQPARDRLLSQGVRCLLPGDAASPDDYIRTAGAKIDLFVLCRVYCGGNYLEAVQEHGSGARIVFDTIDLNFLREERRARLTQDAALEAILPQIRQREEHVIRSCDATMVVSQAELDLLASTMPGSLVVQMPLARTIQPPQTPFAARRGIGFIGGFSHAPNVDALAFFLREVWPAIHARLPGCEFSVVGADPPLDLLDGTAGVRFLGHVPDVGPWFESLRLTVAPLRFGAGAKGKVASSLAAGVPCIATAVASEGMSLASEAGVRVADTPAAFADAVIRAYGDEASWRRLSAGGLAYAEATLSLAAWQQRLDAMLRRIGL